MYVPFGRVALLLNLGEDAFSLIIGAVAAFGQSAVALYLLFPAHIACL